MATLCPHGLRPQECLICPALPGRRPAIADARRGAPAPAHFAWRVGAVAILVAAAALATWVLVGAIWAAIHVLEVLAAASLAAWAGYRVGLYRGARQARR